MSTAYLSRARKALRLIEHKSAEPKIRGYAALGLRYSAPASETSARLVRAARKNGEKGGRPREELPCRACATPTRERDASRRPWCGCT